MTEKSYLSCLDFFLCHGCDKRKPTLGRKLNTVRSRDSRNHKAGTFICADCAKERNNVSA